MIQWEDYRAEMDAVEFDPSFQERTLSRLMALGSEKERKAMKRQTMRTGLVAAGLAAALCVTAFAAVALLRPQDVARRAGNGALAAAFESGQAVTVNETKTVGGYDVTLMGLVSGEGLSGVEGLEDGILRDKTYAVAAFVRTDGEPVTDDVPELTISPLVEGYAPWQVNAWTLGGGTCTFAEDGTLYYLFECDNVEPFADHTCYLAVYPGTHVPPSSELFTFDASTGAIALAGDGAMFTLPLDKSKADGEKAAALAGGWMDDGDDMPEESASPDDGESREILIVEAADGQPTVLPVQN